MSYDEESEPGLWRILPWQTLLGMACAVLGLVLVIIAARNVSAFGVLGGVLVTVIGLIATASDRC